MKITLGKLVSSISILNDIKQQSCDFKISYWIMRNLKLLSDSYNFFIQSREKIYAKYCDKAITDDFPDGAYFTILENGDVKFNIKENADVKAFDREMNELMNMECEDIKPYLINIDIINSIENLKLSVDEIFDIDYLLSQ